MTTLLGATVVIIGGIRASRLAFAHHLRPSGPA